MPGRGQRPGGAAAAPLRADPRLPADPAPRQHTACLFADPDGRRHLHAPSDRAVAAPGWPLTYLLPHQAGADMTALCWRPAAMHCPLAAARPCQRWLSSCQAPPLRGRGAGLWTKRRQTSCRQRPPRSPACNVSVMVMMLRMGGRRGALHRGLQHSRADRSPGLGSLPAGHRACRNKK